MKSGFLFATLVGAFFLGLALPSAVRARTIEVTPVIGHFSPLVNQTNDTEVPLISKQTGGTAYGARVTWWGSGRIGVELDALIVDSDLDIIENGIASFGAQMIQADARVRWRLNDRAAAAGFDLIAGIGVANLNDPLSGGAEDAGFASPTTLMGVVGLGVTTGLADRINLRLDVEDHFHGTSFEIDDDFYGEEVDTNSQHDLVMTLGLVIRVGGD